MTYPVSVKGKTSGLITIEEYNERKIILENDLAKTNRLK